MVAAKSGSGVRADPERRCGDRSDAHCRPGRDRGSMTTIAPAPTTSTITSSLPRRRTLVLLAVTFVTVFVAALATGADTNPDSSLATIESAHDQSYLLVMITSYAGMAAC